MLTDMAALEPLLAFLPAGQIAKERELVFLLKLQAV